MAIIKSIIDAFFSRNTSSNTTSSENDDIWDSDCRMAVLKSSGLIDALFESAKLSGVTLDADETMKELKKNVDAISGIKELSHMRVDDVKLICTICDKMTKFAKR